MARRIKRYDNRKLYDTESSEYVSLSDIAQLVRSGETVEVIDNATGEDRTAQTLTQIILEEGKNGHDLLPSELLHTLLRRSGEMVDTGIGQIRSTVDELMESSLGRLKTLVQSQRAQELDELRSELRTLEVRLSALIDSVKEKQPSTSAGSNAPSMPEPAPETPDTRS